MRQVPYINFSAQFAEEKADLMAIVERVFQRGELVGGSAIDVLEDALAKICGTRHAVALNSGTDALTLGMKALGLGPGDEIITPPNSFVASTAAIIAIGATPVFADVRDDQNIDPMAVEAALSPRTAAIMPVHLTGRAADMDPLQKIADRHGLAIVEDAAQSIGCKYKDRPSGSFGQIGCFSAHPLKNLNAAGDAGFLVTDDEAIARKVRLLGNHGLADRNTVVSWGTVSRMDVLQAEILFYRLHKLDQIILARRSNAECYRASLSAVPIYIAPCQDSEFNTFHLFVVQTERRDELMACLGKQGIATGIHYPVPVHLQPAAAGLGYKKGSFPHCERQAEQILSLPVNQYLSAEDIDWVSRSIKEFLA